MIPTYDFSTKKSTIDAIISECRRQGITSLPQIAYILATVQHETGDTYQPVYEAHYLGKARALRYLRKLKYWPYYGRGFVQITWLANYRKYSKKLGVDLVKNPDLAMNPTYAIFILVDGFKHGEFTGKKISDYVNDKVVDFLGARRCINGKDKAAKIAGHAKIHLQNLKAAQV